MKEWQLGSVYFLLKIALWACSILIGSVLFALVTTHGGLHAHSNNINCAIECLKNPLNQSIPNMLDQRASCLVEKQRLEMDLGECKQNLRDSRENYTTEVQRLANMKKEKDVAVSEKDQIKNDYEQSYTNVELEKNIMFKQKKSCLVEKGQLQGRLIRCRINSIELKSLLNNATNKSKQLATYIEHLQLLEVIDNHTRELHTCRVWLKEYCTLKQKSSTLDKYDNDTMNTFAEWLGCEDPLLDASHYDKILPSFTRRVKSILEVREMLEQMLIKGDFKAMRKAQEGVKNLPSEKCKFLCTYNEDEENKESDDESSSFAAKAFEGGWNIFTRIWWSTSDN